ncbi:MAG: pyridoxal 5'-phosphate synthase glutaminase subunit PdxT [Patescibacteria group bacterium]
MKIGVLDIQGSVEEHLAILQNLGENPVAVKTKADLAKVSGLIIPGGESTTIGKLLAHYGLSEEIARRAQEKSLTIWGTCAGAILIAKKVINRPPQNMALMDITIKRNAYGRQIDSFKTPVSIPILGATPFQAVFIRAPQVKVASAKAKVLAKYGKKPIMVRQNNLLATMFHPELTTDGRIHKYFIKMTQEYVSKKSKN